MSTVSTLRSEHGRDGKVISNCKINITSYYFFDGAVDFSEIICKLVFAEITTTSY